MIKTQKFAIEIVDSMVALRNKRAARGDVYIARTPPEKEIDADGHLYREMEMLQIRRAESEYAKKPKENIPDVKKEDFSCSYSDFRNLPRLLTV